MGNAVGEDDPAFFRRAFACARPRDVHDVMVAKPRGVARPKLRESEAAGVRAQHPPGRARRILRIAQDHEEKGAEHDPRQIQRPEAKSARHGSYNNDLMTRAEIEHTLLDIVRKEKELPEGDFSEATVLADAGIDSLDALTILFAIEEHFKISIPDDRARRIRTFGDMIDAVEGLLAATQ